jgi:hypothetical protein
MNSEFREMITHLETELKLLEDDIQTSIRDRNFDHTEYNQKAIWRKQKELALLNKFAEKKYYKDEQEIDNALIELSEGELESFSLEFYPDKDFYLNFSLVEKQRIRCELPTDEELNDGYHYFWSIKSKRKLLSLGFSELKDEKRLYIDFEPLVNNSCIEIKTILSILLLKIVYITLKRDVVLIKRPAGSM